MQRLDPPGDGRADTRDGLQRAAVDHLVQRANEVAEARGRAHIGLGLVRVAAFERGAAPDLVEKVCNLAGSSLRHAG
jgi:hypothetical protein